jgi:hypothetical protein
VDAYAKLVAVVAVSEAAFAQAASVKFTSPLLGPGANYSRRNQTYSVI